MNLVAIVRHGACRLDDALTLEGITQARNLGKRLRALMADPVRIFSSTALRACATAQIVAREFGIDFLIDHILYSSGAIPENPLGVWQFAEQHGHHANGLIFISHLENVSALPQFFGERLCGKKPSEYPEYTAYKGEGWLLDCAERTIRHVP